ncbi:Fic family protein [Williamsia sterculiae]|uniref:Fic/DOC family protein n=1 Tax=Williamsia sterculiae TaxID=1344003 RepID=A0A1N7F3X7_9NOCA|nr:Fic family protein [Williamsia sterculiae]SIR94932.1 Fic/DOC family protein [Williamsia sterculiae]
MTTDPLAPLAELPGVAEAAARAGDALAAAHRHPVNLRGWDKTATEASWRAGRSSAAIEGARGDLTRDGVIDDPVLAGSMRVAQALDPGSLGGYLSTWTRAPRQTLARLHVLAAADLVDDPDVLGRPRPEPGVGERLDLLAQLVTGATRVPAPVLAAVVHGELLSIQPFVEGNGVVARAASRLVCAATGLDPHNLGVPEVTWLARLSDYRADVSGFTSGDPDALTRWILLCSVALSSGADEARAIADAAR